MLSCGSQQDQFLPEPAAVSIVITACFAELALVFLIICIENFPLIAV
jgi:hypothetical protein